MSNAKIKVFFIHHVCGGLLGEYEPVISLDESEAFSVFNETVTGIGFREPEKEETFEQYRKSFYDFESRYRDEFPSITSKEKKIQIANSKLWLPDENEIQFYEKEFALEFVKVGV